MTFRPAAALFAASVAVALSFVAFPASAQDKAEAPDWRHGLSLFGDVRYPPDFKHFAYVNPAAPKGGRVRLGAFGTFDSFNGFIPKGNAAAGLHLVYDTLMIEAGDEPATEYGLIAEAVRYPPDYSSVTYRLRAEARFNDGKPVTPEDVVWSFQTLKRIDPLRSRYYHDVTKAEVTGEREVTFTFSGPGNRELPQITGQIPILPKHYWEGTDGAGKKRNIEEGTLEKPLGSGPYRIKDFAPGRSIAYERVADYWGAKLPVRIGSYNFDEMRYDYYRDATVLVEAFKGDQFDYREENSAKNWATAYDFPALNEKRVVKELFRDSQSGRMQSFAFNIRRDKFKDPRVRRAFNLAFDFEEVNRSLFYSQYVRIDSYFFGTDLASKGLPEGREKQILESVKDMIPPEVFTSENRNPVGGSPEAARKNLREAARLLKEAGWEIKDGKLVNATSGERLSVEFLYYSDPNIERLILAYKPALERLGIGVALRSVDVSQYLNRTRSFDFDLIVQSWGQSLSPGNEQRDMWGSQAADMPGSQNVVGIKDPGVDALIEKIVYAKDREELTAATHALDRVLLAHAYVVPQYTIIDDRTIRWDRFSRPATLPPRGAIFPTVWWWDAEKAKAVGGRN